MQRHGQLHLEALARQPPDARNDPAGAERDAPRADVQAVRMIEDAHGFENFVVIVERLAHAHVDDVVGPLAERRRHELHLRDDLPRRKAARESALGARAKHAAHPAAHLRRHADRVAVARGNQHGFDAVAVGEADEPFARAARLAGFLPDRRRLRRVGFRQLLLQRARQIAHLLPARRVVRLQPVPELRSPERGLARLLAEGLQLFRQQSLQGDLHAPSSGNARACRARPRECPDRRPACGSGGRASRPNARCAAARPSRPASSAAYRRRSDTSPRS